MDPIDSVSRAMQLLRQRMAAQLPKQAAGPSQGGAGAVVSPVLGPGLVRTGIAGRLRALNAKDPGYPERATETFVEGVLLAEFGTELTNDAQFRQVILGVAREMRAEPETAQQVDQLIHTLRDE